MQKQFTILNTYRLTSNMKHEQNLCFHISKKIFSVIKSVFRKIVFNLVVFAQNYSVLLRYSLYTYEICIVHNIYS